MFDFVFPQFFAGEVRKKLEEDMSTMKGNTMPTTADLAQEHMGLSVGLSEAMQRADGVAAQMRPKEASETSKIITRLEMLLMSAGTTCSKLHDIEKNLLGQQPESGLGEKAPPHEDSAFGSINDHIDKLEELLRRIHMTTGRLERV